MKVVKESSDVLIPPVVEPAHIVVPARRRTAGDYLALALATFGVGLIPLAPGTWGSAVGVGIYLLLTGATEVITRGAASPAVASRVILSSLLIVVIFALFLGGTWAATRAEKLLGKKDPGAVVVDEVGGQLIAFLYVAPGAGWWTILVAFLAFRLFDIWKPYPIRRLEGLEKGLGVMADDLLAGWYAAALMSMLAAIQMFM